MKTSKIDVAKAWLANQLFKNQLIDSYQEGFQRGRSAGVLAERVDTLSRLEKHNLRDFSNPYLRLGYDQALAAVQDRLKEYQVAKYRNDLHDA